MITDQNSISVTDWMDVAPTIFELHEFSLDPYLMRWPRLAWNVLNEHSPEYVVAKIDRLDSKLMAVSVTRLHLEFLVELHLSFRDSSDYFDLEGITTRTELLSVITGKYDCSLRESDVAKESAECLFSRLYDHHLQLLRPVLVSYFGSATALCDSLIETAAGPENGENSFTLSQLGAAYDFVSSLVGVDCDDNI